MDEAIGPWNDWLAKIEKPRNFYAQLMFLTKMGL